MKIWDYAIGAMTGAVCAHFAVTVAGNLTSAIRYILAGYPNATQPTVYVFVIALGAGIALFLTVKDDV